MAGKVRAAVLMVRDAARIKVLQLKADRAFSELGKAAFGKFGVQSGPYEVTGPIAAYLSRIQEIDAEIGQLSEPGRIVTPRRLAVGMVVAIAMLCCVALLATGPTPEQKRIKRAALAYRSVPSSARDALNAVEKLESRIEVGMNHGDYITLVGETWVAVKLFVESADGKSLPELSDLLRETMCCYKDGAEAWQKKIESSFEKPKRTGKASVDKLLGLYG